MTLSISVVAVNAAVAWAACPHNVIEMVEGKPKQTAKASAPADFCGVSEGAGCDVCATVCPRLWPRETHLRQAVSQTIGRNRGKVSLGFS